MLWFQSLDSRPEGVGTCSAAAQHPQRRRALAAIIAVSIAACALAPAPAAAAPPVAGRHGMVVAPEAHAAEAGLEALQRGGSAVDAAIAATFTLSVTYPPAAPLGGGGFLLHRSAEGVATALDFRETAPHQLEASAFLDASGQPRPDLARRSGLAVGVPGTVAGLLEAHRRWGRLPWSELVAPAIELASEGFAISPWLAANLGEHRGLLREHKPTRAIFAREGRAYGAGDRLVQRDLARTLRRIAREGAGGFYDGPVARAIVSSVAEQLGVLTPDDLEGYSVRPRPVLRGSYRGHAILTFPPPSSGGVALLQMLAMLEPHELGAAGFHQAATVHRVVEVERRAFADRARWLGDPDFVEVPVAGLLERTYLERRAASIEADRATPSSEIGGGLLAAPVEASDTLHLSVADSNGDVVALTATLNGWYGSGIVARGTGILLNNEMDDFALAPGAPNQWGLVGDAANAIASGKRPLSSMTPTVVEQNPPGPRPLLVLGSPGGPAIITSVLQVIVNVIDHDLPLEQAVAAPRYHHQWLPDRILYEAGAFTPDVSRTLAGLGHHLVEAESTLGDVNTIVLDAGGAWVGLADPRRSSAARGH